MLLTAAAGVVLQTERSPVRAEVAEEAHHRQVQTPTDLASPVKGTVVVLEQDGVAVAGEAMDLLAAMRMGQPSMAAMVVLALIATFLAPC